MKKFSAIFLSFAILLVAVVGFLWLTRAKLVASFLSKQIGSPVTIESIHLKEGHIEVGGFSIHTPSDPIFPVIFSIDYLNISASFWDLVFHNVKEIDEIYLKDVFVAVHMYNQSGIENNWTKLLSKMQKEESQEKEEEKDIKFVIEKLLIQNANLRLKKVNRNEKKFPTLNIQLKHIGSSEPASVTKIAKLVISEVVRQLTIKYGLQKIFGELLNPKNWLKEFGDTLKKFPKKIPFF